MKRLLWLLLLFCCVSACKNRNLPDVSGIKVNLPLQRFEQDFFAIDTTNINVALEQLNQKYPGFLQDFIFNILALPAEPDSISAVENGVRSFISSYREIKDTSDIVFRDLEGINKSIEEGLKYVKYHFPTYKLPAKLITFIGPINSYGNIITPDALGVGLQLYLGKNYGLYASEAGQSLYPAYVSRRFEPVYIPVNTIKTVIDDMFPNNSGGRPLVEQMVEAGKRLYVLDQLLPGTADTLKTGYTEEQLKGSRENEALIWGLFLQNEMLYSADPAVTKDYMNDAPNTPVLGPGSPGFIGQFVGWQIVKKWMDKNGESSLQQLMETGARKIFDEAKYKPK
ncbi:hypothetical protein EXU57_11275 [Segetibacter sp. 3557_3]|uniref:gliding motility lipoprotein GldB n=1 Tax=Segetibacter sp. 3557_3 TaxID=2547429 RepID=UPI0010587F00|nr:hypothetical protein [Segetibacter sp. 3557_3]TDH26074.1 hypothetical protein EXU57_11275 [Segetibacter sp. 3557_3]